MASQHSPRRFLGAYLACALVPTLLLGTLNLVVDPLALLSWPGIAGVNTHKPMLRDKERLFKPLAVTRLRPQAVILGSSRSNHALDPLHPALRALGAYNLSLSGTNIRETRELFEHAVATGALKSAVIELDMGFFDVSGAAADMPYLATPGHPHRLDALLTVLATAFAWHTVPLSLQTLQGQGEPAEYTALGQQTEGVFRWRIASYRGVRNTFEGYMRRLAPSEAKQAAAWRAAGIDRSNFPGMPELRRIIELAGDHDVALAFYISPAHAIDLETVRSIHGWEQIEDWKRALVQTLDSERARTSRPLSLWDFSGYNAVTTETVPAAQDSAAEMQYYWDQSHYRVVVGNWILERIFDLAPAGPAPPPSDFGIRLTPANLEATLTQVRAGADNYRLSHPLEAGFVQRLVAETKAEPAAKVPRS